MPRLFGIRERLHQPFWDTAFRTTGTPVPPITNRITLFGNANTGSFPATNLQVPGQFSSDKTFVLLSIRVCPYFDCAVVDCEPPVEGASNTDISNGFF